MYCRIFEIKLLIHYIFKLRFYCYSHMIRWYTYNQLEIRNIITSLILTLYPPGELTCDMTILSEVGCNNFVSVKLWINTFIALCTEFKADLALILFLF